jgi:hypothetical protein
MGELVLPMKTRHYGRSLQFRRQGFTFNFSDTANFR